MSFVVKISGKQYHVNYGDKLVVDRLPKADLDTSIELPVLFDLLGNQVKTLQAKVVSHFQGKKLRVVRFRSKSNYHKVKGFRPKQTLLQIVSEKKDDKKNVIETVESIKTEAKVVKSVAKKPTKTSKDKKTEAKSKTVKSKSISK